MTQAISVTELCQRVQISRQGYYRHQRVRKKKELLEGLIIGTVKKIRTNHPLMGGRKLQFKMKEDGVYIGRDRLFSLLRQCDLLIKKRRRIIRTTDSRHGFRTYSNLLKDIDFTEPNQAWVSDITYIDTYEGFLYLSLISDAYSRKIVGYNLDDCLWSAGCEKSLISALKDLPSGKHPIHHSDRGKQYCSKTYVERLKNQGMAVSMTEENHCYENAMAERLNGILKHEYGLGEKFLSKEITRKAVKEAVLLYNTDRPHMKLGMKTPHAVHMDQKENRAAKCDPNGSQVKRKKYCQLLIRT